MLYLAQSTYGKNAEIWPNNSSTFVAGCAGSSSTYVAYAGCESTYDTANGQQASATGNIYGIYDIIGGSRGKFVAAYINNGVATLSQDPYSITGATAKYKDLYQVGSIDNETNNYALTISHKGDALYETSTDGAGATAWYNSTTSMVASNIPYVNRNNIRFGTASAYNFYSVMGGWKAGLGISGEGFRPTLVIGIGL